MSDVNEVWFSGRLTRQPELRHTPSGVALTDLSVASNRYGSRGPDGKSPKYTTFARVTLWKEQAEFACENLNTGSEVLIRGQLFDDNFEQERDDGTKFRTSGRLKIDHARLTIPRGRAASTDEASSEVPADEPQNDQEDVPVA